MISECHPAGTWVTINEKGKVNLQGYTEYYDMLLLVDEDQKVYRNNKPSLIGYCFATIKNFDISFNLETEYV